MIILAPIVILLLLGTVWGAIGGISEPMLLWVLVLEGICLLLLWLP